jgi:hypothetical protein
VLMEFTNQRSEVLTCCSPGKRHRLSITRRSLRRPRGLRVGEPENGPGVSIERPRRLAMGGRGRSGPALVCPEGRSGCDTAIASVWSRPHG